MESTDHTIDPNQSSSKDTSHSVQNEETKVTDHTIYPNELSSGSKLTESVSVKTTVEPTYPENVQPQDNVDKNVSDVEATPNVTQDKSSYKESATEVNTTSTSICSIAGKFIT